MNTSNSKGETTKGAGEIPKHIQEWIKSESNKLFSHDIPENPSGIDYEIIDELKGKKIEWIEGAKALYHHLTTSIPSNSALKSAHEILSTKKQHAFQSGYYHFGVVIEAMKEFAEQSQPQLVSGVRTREDILESNNIKSNEDVNPKYWPYYYSQILNAMEEYKNQFHPTQPELKGRTNRRITLCGSTKFKDAFIEWNKTLSKQGNIVYSVSCFGNSGDTLTKDEKETLDLVHKMKIDNSDEIFVLDVGGYVGESTRSEIEYAELTGKPVKYLSKEHPEYVSGEHHPTQEIEGEKVYRKVYKEAPKVSGSYITNYGEIEYTKEANNWHDGYDTPYFPKYWLEEIPLSTHTSEGREAIELLRDSFKSELFELHLTKGLEKRADKAFKIIGKLESILLNGLEGKGREDLGVGGSNSDSASVVTPHSSAGNSSEQ